MDLSTLALSHLARQCTTKSHTKSLDEQAMNAVLKGLQQIQKNREHSKVARAAERNRTSIKRQAKTPMTDLEMSSEVLDGATLTENAGPSNKMQVVGEGATDGDPASAGSPPNIDANLQSNTSDSSQSGLSTLDSEDARRRSLERGTFEPLASSVTGKDGQVAENCKLLGFQSGMKVVCPVTRLHKDLASIQTSTYLGIRFVSLAPAPLPDYSPASSVQEDASHIGQSAPKPGDIVEESVGSGCKDDSAIPATPLASAVRYPARTFANEFLHIGKSEIPGAGFGMFAVKDISYGEHILLEYPLIRTTVMDLFADFENLGEREKAVFYSLSGYHPRHDADPVERIFNANSFRTDYGLDGVFPIAANFNHACRPQRIGYVWDGKRKLLVLTAVKDIKAHDELLITYGHSVASIKYRFGFLCTCGACASTGSFGADHLLRDFDDY